VLLQCIVASHQESPDPGYQYGMSWHTKHCIQKVLGLNIGLVTGQPELFVVFLNATGEWWDSTLKYAISAS